MGGILVELNELITEIKEAGIVSSKFDSLACSLSSTRLIRNT